MKWELATNKQIKSIVEADGECFPHLLKQALEEAIKRDLYAGYIYKILTKRFGAVKNAERILKLPFHEIKHLCYIEVFTALKYYKPGKYAFLGFWSRFLKTKLRDLYRKQTSQKRTAEFVYLDDQEEFIQIVDDHNTERKVINRITIEELLAKLTPFERTIVLRRNKDYTFPEIGEQLGYSRQYICTTYKRALVKMRGIENEFGKTV
jgi:RNA polymerase sigma factor (sigma-70 family)